MRSLRELTYDQPSIVQRYISDPLTVGGYKTDLRLYDVSPHGNVYGHLTNCSINKLSPFVGDEKDVIGGGCKWSLARLRRWITEARRDGSLRWDCLWSKIRSVVSLTVLLLAESVPGGKGHESCFELFGFDVMITADLSQVYLIEVNCSPALGLDEDTDRDVKLPLLEDLLDLVNVESACRMRRAAAMDKRTRSLSQPGYSRPLNSALRHPRPNMSYKRRGPPSRRLDGNAGTTIGTGGLYPSETSFDTAGDAMEKAHGEGNPHDGGGFERVFPCSEESATQAQLLSDCILAGASKNAEVQQYIRAVIAEIKTFEKKSIRKYSQYSSDTSA